MFVLAVWSHITTVVFTLMSRTTTTASTSIFLAYIISWMFLNFVGLNIGTLRSNILSPPLTSSPLRAAAKFEVNLTIKNNKPTYTVTETPPLKAPTNCQKLSFCTTECQPRNVTHVVYYRWWTALSLSTSSPNAKQVRWEGDDSASVYALQQT